MKKRDHTVSESVPTESASPEPRVRWREAEPGEMGGVMFVVGPPTDSLLRPRFDEYQAMKAAAISGATETSPARDTLQWEEHERAVLSVVFDRREEGEPSAVEEMLSVEHRSPVRLKGYQLSFVWFREHWLAVVSIDSIRSKPCTVGPCSGRRGRMCSRPSRP